MKHVLLSLVVLLWCGMAAAEFDLGDLPACNYPTFFGNPAHTMSGKAWLGECITSEGEGDPNYGDLDGCDDGVNYLNLPWMPCEVVQVQVTITAGPYYDDDPLYLSGWKDGNLDGDFCDELCASEWIVQDVGPLAPGVYTFSFVDPGVFDMGVYDGVFRWRLAGRTMGRMGFGWYDPFGCEDMPVCGSFASDSLGEVEDYWIDDAQLDVVLSKEFDAIPGDGEVQLTWTTASESGGDHFEITRNGTMVASIVAEGSVSSGHAYAWMDRGVVNGTSYHYELIGVDAGGHRESLGMVNATPSASEAIVSEYALHQNYPNPFNPSTSITFDLVESGSVSLKVFDIMGREVAVLVNGSRDAGRHTVAFDATSLPSALYIYTLSVNGFEAHQKMLLMK